MEEQNSNAYSEALAVLKLLDDEEKLEKLPIEMLEVLKAKANPEYKPEFSKEIPIDEQNISPEALGILSWIAMKYWNEEVLAEENQAEQIIENKELNEKTEKITKETIEKQVDQESHLQEQIEKQTSQEQQDTLIIDQITYEEHQNKQTKVADSALPILYKDLKWYQKIKMKIIEFFNKILKRHNIKGKNSEEEGNTL